jgi:branched-chain amino acid transport system permease protein
VVLMTLVGGMGTVFGPIAGAAIIVAMQNYLSGFGEWVLVIQGAIFVTTVLLFRRGIVGEVIALVNRGRGEGAETSGVTAGGEVKPAE